jgi:ubiquinone/menaquinone biosynthesis C-methylase UbiE
MGTAMDSVKELVRRHWDRRAADFDDESPSHGLRTDAQTQAWQRLIAEIAGPTPIDALDVGCDTGFLSLLLAERGHRVTGVDVAPAMLGQARKKAAARGLAARFIEADAEALDLPEASLDLIVESGTCCGPCRIRRWRWTRGGGCCGRTAGWF